MTRLHELLEHPIGKLVRPTRVQTSNLLFVLFARLRNSLTTGGDSHPNKHGAEIIISAEFRAFEHVKSCTYRVLWSEMPHRSCPLFGLTKSCGLDLHSHALLQCQTRHFCVLPEITRSLIDNAFVKTTNGFAKIPGHSYNDLQHVQVCRSHNCPFHKGGVVMSLPGDTAKYGVSILKTSIWSVQICWSDWTL